MDDSKKLIALLTTVIFSAYIRMEHPIMDIDGCVEMSVEQAHQIVDTVEGTWDVYQQKPTDYF